MVASPRMRRNGWPRLASLALSTSVIALALCPARAARAQGDGAVPPEAAEGDGAVPPEAAAEGDGAPAPGAPAPTEAELADARHSFELASTAYTGGDYETAAEEFRAAYEVTRHPELLFNIYLAEERAGRPAEAAEVLALYLELATSIGAEERPLLERRLERLRARAASRVTTPPPADELDDSALLSSPMEPSASPEEVDAGDAAARPTPATTGGSPPGAAIALVVTAGVLLAGFAVLAPLSEVEDQRLASSCGRDAGRSCTAGETTGLMALNLAADASWIAATVAGVVGVVLWATLPSEGGTAVEASVALAPWASPSGAGVTAGGTF